MKRCWVGAIFLLVLLLVSLGVSWAMDRIHEPIGEDLNRAAELALLGNWEGSRQLFLQARGRWDEYEHVRACFADHTPVEEVDAGFRALEVYCLARETADFAAHARELARKTAAMGDAHGLSWWNVL